jgi:glycosyltransferase involved in cell wall biosynthesis
VRILLVGNYAPDRQESMARYARVLDAGLTAAGHEVRTIAPPIRFNRAARPPTGAAKWLGYVDKLIVGPDGLHRGEQWADVVHVCDHSNAFYVPRRSRRPWVVTCHDLLAVRGALGEDTDCPASPSGRLLQRAIVRGLQRARLVAAVSHATLRDVHRVVGTPDARTVVVAPPLNHPFRVLPTEVVRERLAAVPDLAGAPYVLMVGSDQPRKNREATVRMLGRVRTRWPGRVVFAGEPPGAALRAAIAAHGVADRVVAVPSPTADLLEALYAGAHALLFPSRFEGFGWPPLEAQACGCPVITSDAPPMPEVAGQGALVCSLQRETEFDDALLALTDPALRRSLVARGLRNVAHYDVTSFAARWSALYGAVA